MTRPQDRREYVRVAVDLPLSPKLAAIDDPAVSWLYVCALCYCGQNLTDGHFPTGPVTRLAGSDPTGLQQLADAGMVHLPGHGCRRCPQPRKGSAFVHDYLRHQRSAEQAERAREAGRNAAAARWGDADRNADRIANGNADGSTNGIADSTATGMQVACGAQCEGHLTCGSHCPSYAEPNAEVEVSNKPLLSEAAAPPRDDVNELCNRLHDKIVSNGSKATITDTWRKEARLLLDRDRRDLSEALRLIDWCQQDQFWRSNILSMPKFRTQYDRLRLRAQQDSRYARPEAQHRDPTSGRAVDW